PFASDVNLDALQLLHLKKSVLTRGPQPDVLPTPSDRQAHPAPQPLGPFQVRPPAVLPSDAGFLALMQHKGGTYSPAAADHHPLPDETPPQTRQKRVQVKNACGKPVCS